MAALMPLCLLAGCGGDDERDVPDGWKVTPQPWFAFAHPAGWRVTTRDAENRPGEKVTLAVAPGTDAPNVVVGATPGFGTRFEDLVEINDANTLVELPERRKLSERAVDVPGAERARLVEYALPAGAPRSTSATPVRAFDLIALSEDGTAVNLFARVREADVERSGIRDVVASLRLR